MPTRNITNFGREQRLRSPESPTARALQLGHLTVYYDKHQRLGNGAGSSSRNYVCLDANGKRYALKEMFFGASKKQQTERPPEEQFQDDFRREVTMLRAARPGDCIAAALYGNSLNDPKRGYIVQPLYQGTLLTAWNLLSPEQRRASQAPVVRAVAKDLQLLHGKGLVHNDIKLDNVFLGAQRGGSRELKLADFGLSAFAREHDSDKPGNANRYAAPETARHHISPASDVYSLGMMTLELTLGWHPFRHVEEAFGRGGSDAVRSAAYRAFEAYRCSRLPSPTDAEQLPAAALKDMQVAWLRASGSPWITLLNRALAADPARRRSLGDVVSAIPRGTASGGAEPPLSLPALPEADVSGALAAQKLFQRTSNTIGVKK